jgi:S-methylmethionine-dependent homocysteine/selenocysteine methylase
VAVESLAWALTQRVVVLDGGLSTELELGGHDVSSSLWSARLLRDDPDAILQAHRAFADAGAEVATSASYQATFPGFEAAGIARDDAARLMRLSVRLAREAGSRWVAASAGPYGAYLAGGQEYTGDYGRAGGLGVAGLRAFHRPRLEVLASSGADVLAAETIPCLREWEALLAEVSEMGVPAWLSLTTTVDTDGVVRTRLGEPAAEAFAAARGVCAVVAVGVNCTAPGGVSAAVRLAAECSGLPVVAYPNSGETWDGVGRVWRGTPGLDGLDVRAWVDAGARLVGGCCRVRPAHVAEVASAVSGT